MFSNLATLSRMPLLIRRIDDLLELVESQSEIHPGAPD